MSAAPSGAIRGSGLFLGALLLVFPYIDLGISLPIAGRRLDAPLADLLGAAGVAVFGLAVLRSRPVLAGPVGYAVVILAGALGALHAPAVGDSLYTLLRKPIFMYVAYGVVLATLVRRADSVVGPLRLGAGVLAALSLYASADRILAGSALWPDAPLGLTNNHKTLAVAAAPLLALLWGADRSRVGRGIALALCGAILLSWSRTAWISLAAAMSFFLLWRGRPLAARRGVLAGVVALGLLGATYGPVLMKSAVQLDSMRSRHSLDKRAWTMTKLHPLVGMGPGSGVKIELVTFPDYRVNGVDAHGVVQKLASEHGLLGLGGYLLFFWGTARRVRAAHREGDGAWPAFVALHLNLLLSTETFSQTHWVPWALVWGAATRREGA